MLFRSTLAVSGFRLRARLGFSIPVSFLWPARHYPRVRIQRSSFERRRDFNPHEQYAAQHTLRPHPTPHRRSCGPCGLGLFPPGCSLTGQSTMRSLVLEIGFSCIQFLPCAWGLRLRGISARTRDSALAGVAFPLYPQGRHPSFTFSKLNTLPADAWCLRRRPHDRLRKTQGPVVRYSFPVGLFHSLLHAGLSSALGCPAMARLRPSISGFRRGKISLIFAEKLRKMEMRRFLRRRSSLF